MKSVFVDSFYFFAILNPQDAAHHKAIEYSQQHSGPLVTTTEVLTELADGLARSPRRKAIQRVLNDLHNSPDNVVHSPNQQLWDDAMVLYESRPDKQWSLTDCVSFTIMEQMGITDALTGDHHFEQAGFRALLK